MVLPRVILSSLIVFTAACHNGHAPEKEKPQPARDTVVQKTVPVPAPVAPATMPDSVKRFTPDRFRIPDALLDSVELNHSAGGIVANDKAWFAGKTNGQVAVIEVATDHHRLASYLFYKRNPPPLLIGQMAFTKDAELVPFEQKIKLFPQFVAKSRFISDSFFITYKGSRLGDSKAKAIQLYGKPDEVTGRNSRECLKWTFTGEYMYKYSKGNDTLLNGKPLALDSWGHTVYLFFRNDLLEGIALYEDIP